MAEVEEREEREEREEKKEEPPRPDFTPLEPRWTIGKGIDEDTKKKTNKEKGN